METVLVVGVPESEEAECQSDRSPIDHNVQLSGPRLRVSESVCGQTDNGTSIRHPHQLQMSMNRISFTGNCLRNGLGVFRNSRL